MKNSKLILSAMVLLTLAAFTFTSCKKDDTTFNLVSLLAGSSDLNGATSASDVAVNSNIVATFSTDVDASTANNTNITMSRDYDNANIALTVSSSGNTVTIDPDDDLGSGTLYHLNIGAGVKGSNGTALVAIARTFTTVGTFAPADAIANWKLDGNTNDETGTYNASSSTAITYVAGRNTAAGQAAVFDGSTSIIQIPNAAAIDNGPAITLAFWVYGDTLGHQKSTGGLKGNFVLGAGFFHGIEIECGADWSFVKLGSSYLSGTDTIAPDFFVNADGMDAAHGGWQGIAFEQDLTSSGGIRAQMAEKWAHVVITYDAATKLHNLYLNGQLIETDDYHLWPDGDLVQSATDLVFNSLSGQVGPNFVLGFASDPSTIFWADTDFGNYANPDAHHFKGMLDDVKIWHRALTDTEITLMYNSEK